MQYCVHLTIYFNIDIILSYEDIITQYFEDFSLILKAKRICIVSDEKSYHVKGKGTCTVTDKKAYYVTEKGSSTISDKKALYYVK